MFRLDGRRLAGLSFALLAVAAVAVMAFAPDALAGVLSFHSDGNAVHDVMKASAVLIALRGDHAALMTSATAKMAELKDGLTATAIAKIEADHAEIVAQAAAVQLKIDAEVATLAAAAKPWTGAFYLSAAAANIPLMTLNTIVTESADLATAKDRLIDAMATAGNADKPGALGARAAVGAEATQKFVLGATASLIAKVSMFNAKGKPDPAGERNEFSALSLRELARMSMELRGIRTGHDPMTMIQAAFAPVIMSGALSTSDFVNILANVANKSMLKGYEESAETFDLWTSAGTLTDFKIAKRVDLGLFPSLEQVDEGAEYNYASVSDRGVQLVLATYGKIFPITRQAIINDDLSAFTKIPAKMGSASKRTIGNLVYAVITGNPVMPDTKALFHAAHNNLQTGAGSALSATSLDAGRTLMGRQTDPDNIKQGLNIRPAYWIGPVTLEGQAKQIFFSQSEPGQANPGVANRVANMAKPIAESRLDLASTTAWYLAADPASNDTIEVSYLNGVQAPVLEQREGFISDGVEMKIRLDAGVNLLDFRGLQKSAGA